LAPVRAKVNVARFRATRSDAAAVDEQPEGGLDAIAEAAQERHPRRVRIATGLADRGDETDAPMGQLVGQAGRVVVAIPEQLAGGALGEGRRCGELRDVGRRLQHPVDQAGPAKADMRAERVERPADQVVLAVRALRAAR
jgi:hypothetical protein